MVLQGLSQQIAGAFHRLNRATVIDDETVNEVLKEITNALMQADVNAVHVIKLKSNVRMRLESEGAGANKRKLIQTAVFEELVQLVSSDKEPYKLKKGRCNVIMFVGLQGSGKTTTCTKYANFYHRKGWKTAMVCADTFRAGALDQMKQNAAKIRVPFYGDYNETDPVKIAAEGVQLFKEEKYDLIIVDTSGRHMQEAALFDEMKQVEEVVQPDDIVYIMDSHVGQACHNQVSAFQDRVNVGSVIVTKLDGHAKGGGALSAVAATGSPITFVGQGEHFDQFQIFEPEPFIRRLLGMGDLKGLVQSIKDMVPLDKQKQMENRNWRKDKFSLRDFSQQLQILIEMGSANIIHMLPGMSQLLPGGGNQKDLVKLFKRFLVILDSLKPDELDDAKKMQESRWLKVAKGSGSTMDQVRLLQQYYKSIAQRMEKLGKGSLGKNLDKRQIERSMDPHMLQQMGGIGNLMSMKDDQSRMQKIIGKMSLK